MRGCQACTSATVRTGTGIGNMRSGSPIKDRAMEGGDDHRHPPLQAQLCQFVVDRPMRDAAPRDGDVVAGGKPFGGDIAVEQRMILARCAQQGRGEQVLHLGFLRMLAGSADIQVDPALHHRVIVGSGCPPRALR
ncbi:hypothetical protein G6F63_014894 [Rhizopus arrhizus]|nr:hypothetical protein G6F63_014894 [Rhizopus arrhizus]